MAVPNIFGTATAAIPLSQLDTNFATAITLGNTAVYLGNTTTSLGNVTLTNVTISSGNVTITGANISGTANVSTLIVTGNQTSLGNVTVTGNVSANIVTVAAGAVGTPSITTTGDTNTGIFFPAADTIAFSEGGAEAMRIDSSGNVGIGTASPNAKLQVSSSTDFGAVLKVSDTSSESTGFVVLGNGNSTDKAVGIWRGAANSVSSSGTFLNLGGYGGMAFSTGAALLGSQTERMRIDSSGNVLVNTTSNIAAGAKLFAVGSGVGIAVGYGTGSAEYRHLYMNSGDGTLYFFNPTNYASLSAAGAWVNASDARLKKNIVDIKYGLSDVLKAQPRSYQMNSLEGDYIGFVAQELQTVIPEVVSGDPEKQLGVDYGSLVAVAFKAIQEQQALITALTARITALESK